LFTKKIMGRHDPAKGRTMYSWLYESMRYQFYHACLMTGRRTKYNWSQHEVPVSSLGEDMTLDSLHQAVAEEENEEQ
jgi:hypothetical protein